jgi:hypothetical protein
MLGVSTSTARRWTLGIDLAPQQLASIDARRKTASRHASLRMAERRRMQRAQWQLEGRARAREGDLLHQAGCLLYWAEGRKDRNTVRLTNSDVHLLRVFRRFLACCFGIQSHDLNFRLHVYTGNGLTIPEIERHWMSALELPRSSIRKHSINPRPAATSGKKNKLPYGVCSVEVLRSTWLAQHIFGAIQEYGGFEEPGWLD